MFDSPLIDVIRFQMRITQLMHQDSGLEITDLPHNHRKECMACNIERLSGHPFRTIFAMQFYACSSRNNGPC